MKRKAMPTATADYMKKANDGGSGISIFDPVLCEAMYLWFSKENAIVLDPFAGGSVRGIVASKMKRQYIGVELRREQVEANREQGKKLCPKMEPIWHCGDSQDIQQICEGVEADLIFSCPPYADLEIYSDDPRDISTMDYKEFLAQYTVIITKACALLKPNRFAVFVVGEVRSQKKPGYYYNFVPDTIRAFEQAGLHFYNEAILITAIGTLSIRCARPFNTSRKMGKTHQNILVFVKGDPVIAAAELGVVQMDESLFAGGVGTGEQL